jgi:hypothetical protein
MRVIDDISIQMNPFRAVGGGDAPVDLYDVLSGLALFANPDTA